MSDIENEGAADDSIIIAPQAPPEEESINELNDSFKHLASIKKLIDEINEESDDDSDTGYEDIAEDNYSNYADVDGVKNFNQQNFLSQDQFNFNFNRFNNNIQFSIFFIIRKEFCVI